MTPERLEQIMWEKLKAIPTQEYKSKHGAYEDIISVGKIAGALQKMIVADNLILEAIRMAGQL